ncbi:MAG: hypothetical protein Q9164_002443 [Protoblastenia rupestris]
MRASITLTTTLLTLLFSLPFASASPLTLSFPPNIPALPSSAIAILITNGTTLKAPVTRRNTFIFPDLPSQNPSSASSSTTTTTIKGKTQYLLDIACRDYDFASYGLDVLESGEVEIYRVSRGGIEMGERIRVGDGPVELRVLRARDYYEVRAGFSPLSLLKNPMILIGVVGLAFVMGMPYLMENMDPEMKKEFEEQQKKGGVLGVGGAKPNPLQNFDMAAWMAGQTSLSTGQDQSDGGNGGGGGASKARRRG